MENGLVEIKRFVGMISANKDEYGYAGFSENGTVNAGVAENGREVMYISCDKNSFDRLYI